MAANAAGIGDGEIGEDLAVDADVGRLQAADEARVGRAVGAGGGVDARDPQAAEVALLRLRPMYAYCQAL